MCEVCVQNAHVSEADEHSQVQVEEHSTDGKHSDGCLGLNSTHDITAFCTTL